MSEETKPTKPAESCGNCKFFLRTPTGTYCRRFPRVFTGSDPLGAARCQHVTANATGWCGEWKPTE